MNFWNKWFSPKEVGVSAEDLPVVEEVPEEVARSVEVVPDRRPMSVQTLAQYGLRPGMFVATSSTIRDKTGCFCGVIVGCENNGDTTVELQEHSNRRKMILDDDQKIVPCIWQVHASELRQARIQEIPPTRVAASPETFKSNGYRSEE